MRKAVARGQKNLDSQDEEKTRTVKMGLVKMDLILKITLEVKNSTTPITQSKTPQEIWSSFDVSSNPHVFSFPAS